MTEINFGYQEEPEDGDGIIRARTTGILRSWEFNRSEKTLDILNSEFRETEYPSLYLLFEGKNKVYIGESKNVYGRLKIHIKNPEDKIKLWGRVLVLNDGRQARQSDLNDTVVRKFLELYLIDLFMANEYKVVSQGEPQELNPTQKHIAETFLGEITFFLQKKNKIKKLLGQPGQQLVFPDKLLDILQKKGYTVEKYQAKECVLNSRQAFIRPGSLKPNGWQVTMRGGKESSLIYNFRKGIGYLVVPRDGVLVIPLEKIHEVIKDKDDPNRDTYDIYFRFEEKGIKLVYKNNEIDVTQFALNKSEKK